MFFGSSIVLALGLAVAQVQAQLPKKVFAHYLVATTTATHINKDIDDAKAMGFDGFALNVFQPNANYSKDAVSNLFAHAESVGFKLFFSMDTGVTPDITQFGGLINQYVASSAYYIQYGKPMLSTFNGGTIPAANWTAFLKTLNGGKGTYFIPDFDDDRATWGQPSDGNTNPAFFDKWSAVPDFSGAFSWETAWPPTGGSQKNETTAKDVAVIQTAHGKQKAYMFPLSTLQFKHIDSSQSWWRVGQVNMPQRMTDVLALGSNLPDFIEVITWNDGGESHYIGNVWPEGTAQYAYAQSDHSGWRPLFTSFMAAYRSGAVASGMAPPSGIGGVGAMWYFPQLTSSKCASDPVPRPAGLSLAQDAINWAVVLPSGSQAQVRVLSAGKEIAGRRTIGAGLSYGSVPNISTGAQRLELWNTAGTTLMFYAASAFNVTADNSNLCNFNYEVAPLKTP